MEKSFGISRGNVTLTMREMIQCPMGKGEYYQGNSKKI